MHDMLLAQVPHAPPQPSLPQLPGHIFMQLAQWCAVHALLPQLLQAMPPAPHAFI
jgi:hypothetical protein